MDNKKVETHRKMRVARVELLAPVIMDGMSCSVIIPNDANNGDFEVVPLAEAAGLEGQNFPGYRIRSRRTGQETVIYPYAVRAVVSYPEK
jgi:hypothetical protein